MFTFGIIGGYLLIGFLVAILGLQGIDKTGMQLSKNTRSQFALMTIVIWPAIVAIAMPYMIRFWKKRE